MNLRRKPAFGKCLAYWATATTRQLREALACSDRTARVCRRVLRERGALPPTKRRPTLSPPPAPGTRRHRDLMADLELARRALQQARGRDVLLLRAAVGQLRGGGRHALSPKQRRLAQRVA